MCIFPTENIHCNYPWAIFRMVHFSMLCEVRLRWLSQLMYTPTYLLPIILETMSQVMGFTVNRSLPTGLTAGVLPSRITSSPPESEAIKYYPPTGTKISLPSVNYVSVSLPNLWRSCDNCRRLSEDTDNGRLLVCGGCPGPNYWAAHYCRQVVAPSSKWSGRAGCSLILAAGTLVVPSS